MKGYQKEQALGQGHHRGIGRRIAGGTGKRRAAVAFYSGRA